MLSRKVDFWLLWGMAGVTSTMVAAVQSVSFSRDIQPVFEGSCWKCHGGTVALSKLDLRSRDAALKGASAAPRSFQAMPRKAAFTA
jgi:hypothetical protein